MVIDPFKAMAPDAPVLREDIKDKTDGAHGKRKHYNHIFTWEMGDKDATDAAFEQRGGDDQGADLLSARASLARSRPASASPRSTRCAAN